MTRLDRAFLHAIVETPHDPTARLVYADWLEEQGRDDMALYWRGEACMGVVGLLHQVAAREEKRRQWMRERQ
ncbi:MAG TPA: TIGR02996 domain-containing protein [Gemmataceae bacterium]|jgi:uncharacterized protein (TIGR02996 family)